MAVLGCSRRSIAPFRAVGKFIALVSIGCNQDVSSVTVPIADGRNVASSAATEQPESILVHDFGLVRSGEEAQHQFTVRNTSSHVWRVRATTSSCGCTLTFLDRGEIPPGEELRATVRLETDHWRTATEQTVLLAFFDGVPDVRLVVRADIKPEIDIGPRRRAVSLTPHADWFDELRVVNYGKVRWIKLAVQPVHRIGGEADEVRIGSIEPAPPQNLRSKPGGFRWLSAALLWLPANTPSDCWLRHTMRWGTDMMRVPTWR